MGGPTVGLLIVAWANVLFAVVDGLLWLLTLAIAWGHWGVGIVLSLVFVACAGVQVVAAFMLLRRRAWARHVLLYTAFVRFVLAANSALLTASFLPTFGANAIPAIWMTLAHTVATVAWVWPIVTTAVAFATVMYLRRPDVRAEFPESNWQKWLAIAAPVLAFVILAVVIATFRSRMSPVDRERASRPARTTASARPRGPIEPGVGPATLVPTFDGQPIGDFTAADVRLTLTAIKETPFKTGTQQGHSVERIGTIERPWRVHHGRIRIASVPAGVYEVRLAIDQNADGDPDGEGDLSTNARAELRTGHGPAREDVRLTYVMALREPRTVPYPDPYRVSRAPATYGTMAPPVDEFERLPQVPSHATFAWDPVPGAVSYLLTLDCLGSSEQPKAKLVEPSWTIDLPPCSPPYPWVAFLSATGRDGYPLGWLVPHAFVLEGTPSSRATRGLRPATLTLRPTFDGRAIPSIRDDDVSIDLSAPRAGFVEQSRPRAHVRHGRIKLPRFVPDQYLLTLVIGRDARRRADCRPQPGDFVVTGYQHLRDVHTDFQPESRMLAVQLTMQLTDPEDPASCTYPFTHVQSPVQLRWEPVPEAVDYTVRVTRPKYAAADANEFVVREPSWQGRLAPNEPKDNYFVRITARTAKGTELGLLQHHLVVD